jgi:hypothetical protein
MKDENTFAPLPEHARKMLDAAQEKIAKMGRLCLDCLHCYMMNAMPTYSEWTPGQGLTFRCTKSRWNFDEYKTTKDRLKSIFEMARSCPDFEE